MKSAVQINASRNKANRPTISATKLNLALLKLTSRIHLETSSPLGMRCVNVVNTFQKSSKMFTTLIMKYLLKMNFARIPRN